jgi:hypothetical protein
VQETIALQAGELKIEIKVCFVVKSN